MSHRLERPLPGSNGSNNFGVSVCPAGEEFPLPQPQDYEAELDRLQKLVEQQRRVRPQTGGVSFRADRYGDGCGYSRALL
jgi:hypothetical protein